MSDYFDKDFFKFLFGFLTIIIVSLIIILVAKIYFPESTSRIEKVDQVAGS
ncbi:MAG: hypothetical protein UT25_C0003G0085 [Parcubacteria group bacterium GW2011_GWC1_39_12]|nr:MAG: hypothetical protein UT25_C0003G0085 [Parcubacteria group bacterium GW2011_GWC1_39_12]KKR18969.1 MAG: hypothetical protein UT49_C0005G0036 [Parcubacteria group bacterium GW2011_GWF1_39_37]KKR64778.1 MAG: hypothetical protein UU06_C0041G0002 [Parcubacteria group bacterium GW2011_GWB1_40_5]KKR81200.1 MAG: hypothetical protein UU27_C0015G0015 [Parcubacteria group bacterium GW2011_GWD1_40_9]